MRGPSKDRLVFEVPNKSQTQREYVMDVVDHLSGLLAIVVFVASLSVYCTWSFHVAFNWDWVGNSYSWGLSEDAQSWVSWEFAKPGATNTLVLSERPVGTTASSTLLCALFDDFFFFHSGVTTGVTVAALWLEKSRILRYIPYIGKTGKNSILCLHAAAFI